MRLISHIRKLVLRISDSSFLLFPLSRVSRVSSLRVMYQRTRASKGPTARSPGNATRRRVEDRLSSARYYFYQRRRHFPVTCKNVASGRATHVVSSRLDLHLINSTAPRRTMAAERRCIVCDGASLPAVPHLHSPLIARWSPRALEATRRAASAQTISRKRKHSVIAGITVALWRYEVFDLVIKLFHTHTRKRV